MTTNMELLGIMQRKSWDDLEAWAHWQDEENAELRAENGRLRERVQRLEAALLKIGNHTADDLTVQMDDGNYLDLCQYVGDMLATAEAIKTTCPACGEDRTGKGSLIVAGQCFCGDACYEVWNWDQPPATAEGGK